MKPKIFYPQLRPMDGYTKKQMIERMSDLAGSSIEELCDSENNDQANYKLYEEYFDRNLPSLLTDEVMQRFVTREFRVHLEYGDDSDSAIDCIYSFIEMMLKKACKGIKKDPHYIKE